MLCPKCRTVLEPDAAFCSECGAKAPAASRACPACGSALEDGSRYCMQCGREAKTAERRKDAGRETLAAGILINDRYRVVKRLGRGGMGSVYLADDIRHQRRVAIKIINDDVAGDPDFKARFDRERRLAAKISHPNIAMLLDGGIAENGHPYLVMEYIEGETLAEMLARRGPLPEREALGYLAACANALAEAHRQGIIHRDIKPDNIMVAGRAGAAYVKILDFGLARPMPGGGNSESLALSMAGTILGTPYYMSPEQAQGDPLDERSDIYSLGATAYEILTGKPPFSGDSRLKVLTAHMSQPPPVFHAVAPGINCSAATERIVMRCLAKSPQDRPASAVLLAGEFQNALSGVSGAVHAAPGVERQEPRAGNNYAAAPVAAAGHSGQPLFMHMSIGMLLFMGFITHGLFTGYWVYRNWRYLKERLGLAISPVARGVFYLFFIHTLLGRISRDEEARSLQTPAIYPFLCATGVIAMMLLANVALVIAGILPMLCLIPAQKYINSVNAMRDPGVQNHPLTLGQHVLMGLGALLVTFDFIRLTQ